MTRRTAIVTGSTSGLGHEVARRHWQREGRATKTQ